MSAKKIAKTAKTKKKGSKAKRILRKALLWMFTIVLILILGLIIVAALFEERIGRMVIDELNKCLKTELQVEKAELLGLSYWKLLQNIVHVDSILIEEPTLAIYILPK